MEFLHSHLPVSIFTSPIYGLFPSQIESVTVCRSPFVACYSCSLIQSVASVWDISILLPFFTFYLSALKYFLSKCSPYAPLESTFLATSYAYEFVFLFICLLFYMSQRQYITLVKLLTEIKLNAFNYGLHSFIAT